MEKLKLQPFQVSPEKFKCVHKGFEHGVPASGILAIGCVGKVVAR